MNFSSFFIFFKKRSEEKSIKVGCFGIMNNPEYRQEPWRESISQRLECFDSVCLVCGHKEDLKMLEEAFPQEWKSERLKAVYKYWPFPEWSYEELAKHLNCALELAREQGCDWMIKLDIDTVFHEKDMGRVRKILQTAERKGKWLVSFPKLQFFTPNHFWKKSSIPLAVKMSSPVAYGFDKNKYTDLCQPIRWDGSSKAVYQGNTYDIPLGVSVPENKILKASGVYLYNYDFTFRTYERSVELLYQIEMAHARFWGKGYSGLLIEDITRETSMQDFLKLSKERYFEMRKKMDINAHPKHFQASLKSLGEPQWGFSLWGKILL